VAGVMGKKVSPTAFEVDSKGIPTGVIFEDGIEVIMRKIPKMDVREKVEVISNALNTLASYGVTAVGFMSCTPDSFEALQILRKQGKLPIRVMVYFTSDMMKYLKRIGLRGGYGDDMLRIMGIKIFVDGSLGGRTAFLRRPYSDSNTRGVLRMSKAEIRSILEEAYSLDLQVAIHAIGDGAIVEALGAIEEAGLDGSHCRIEHASVVDEDIIKMMRKTNVIAVVQPHFIISDWWIVRRLGDDRARWAYAFRSMINAGIRVAFSTDAPVEPVNPWLTIYAAVTRGEMEGIELYKYTVSEKLSLEQALECYTSGSRIALGLREMKLRENALADLTIVDRDPYAVSTFDLKRIRNVATIVNGKVVHIAL
ncbi:MAG: amidohydrolase, partial [Thermoprotei archaeon]